MFMAAYLIELWPKIAFLNDKLYGSFILKSSDFNKIYCKTYIYDVNI